MGKRKQARTLFSKLEMVPPEGYYSGDRPNPNLRAFVEAHLRERLYDPEADDYQVAAFTEPINTSKAYAFTSRG